MENTWGVTSQLAMVWEIIIVEVALSVVHHVV